jgi:hypothetical protein
MIINYTSLMDAYIIWHYVNNESTRSNDIYNLAQAMNIAEEQFACDMSLLYVEVRKADDDALIAYFERENEDFYGDDEEEEYEDYCDYDVGFDPYLGCFTDDC